MMKTDYDKLRAKRRNINLEKQESRIIQKEENLEKRSEKFEKKEKELELEFQDLEKQKVKLEDIYQEQVDKLQKIAALSKDEAKAQLLNEVEKQITAEKAAIIGEHTM